MSPRNLFRPSNLDEALDFMSKHKSEAMPVAGGTDILVAAHNMDRSLNAVQHFVDISRVPELRGMRDLGSELAIGAGCTHTEIAESCLVAAEMPWLKRACSQVGSMQIRNRGTLGGNVMNASPAADTLAVLAAMDARAVLASSRGSRSILITELVTGPYKTSACRDELLIAIILPKLGPDYRGSYIRLGRRQAMSIARLSAAVIVGTNGRGEVVEARIAPGSAMPRSRRIPEAEAVLIGRKITREVADKAGEAVAQAMVGETGVRWSTEYKKPALAAIVSRAVMECKPHE